MWYHLITVRRVLHEMELLRQIWDVWSGGLGTAILTALTVMLLAMNAAEKFHRVSSATIKWRAWQYLGRWHRATQRKYRIFLAKRVVLSLLEGQSWRISIDSYAQCLATDQRASGLALSASLVEGGPNWLNDFYVASALEALNKQGTITKAKLYESYSWPTKAVQFRFRKVASGRSVKDETEEIETESYCRVYQGFFDQCPTGPRYESEWYSETKSIGRVEHGTRTWLKESAPPCQRCWETQYLVRDIRMLVDSITEHDLARLATTEVTGLHSEFQTAVAMVCANNRCPTNVPLVKSIVEQGIEIRHIQIEAMKPDVTTEWPDSLSDEFCDQLDAFVKDAMRSLKK